MGTLMTAGKGYQIAIAIFMTSVCFTMLYPFIHVLSVSLSTPAEAVRPGLHLFPLSWSAQAYVHVFSSELLWTGLQNSLFRTIVGTLLMLVFMMMGAYPLSKKYLPHRRFYTTFIVVTMFFSGGLIPTYMLIKSLGLFDSLWVLIVPMLINTFSMLIMRNFLMAIPEELEESAKMDGANDIYVLVFIVVPLSKPILATIALWSAVTHWNTWFDALIYIQDSQKLILQVFLRRLVISNEDILLRTMMSAAAPPETIKAATIMFVTLPILFVYPFLQKYFVKGILIGSVKG